MFRQFQVGPERGLQSAVCESVPRLMIVGGPNGSGKSTMLELLHRSVGQAEGDTHIMYISPNRPWRRSEVSAMTTLGLGDRSFREMIEAQVPPSWLFGVPQGLQFLNWSSGTRSRDTVDDVQSLVKAHIINLEQRRQRAITAMVDNGMRGEELDFDAFAPLKRHVETLLPHLRFARVDATVSVQQRVHFVKLDSTEPIEIEIDDLSSGEKSVVALMWPFIEAQAEELMSPLDPNGVLVRPTILIDEPELHLHPALQLNLVAYMRELAEADQAQFILCTHSTTIIDAALEDELFVLAPPAITGGNQLLPVTSTADRLESLRELTGSAFTITRCRPIVFVEGESVGGRTPADHRVIELLVPESKGWVLVPGHGRTETVRAATDLRQPALTGLPGLSVFALVDRDQGYLDSKDWVVEWPVAMQENLLLDEEALWRMLEPHVSATSYLPQSKAHLRAQLHDIVRGRRGREIQLRVRNRVRRLSIVESVGTVAEFEGLAAKVSQQLDAYVQSVGSRQQVLSLVNEVTALVDDILAVPDEGLKRFHGKEMLDAVFARYASAAGWSGKSAFAYNLAATVSDVNSQRLQDLLTAPVRKITQYVPAELPRTLCDVRAIVGFDDIEPVADTMMRARADWVAGLPGSVDRAAERSRILAIARRLEAAGLADDHKRLISALVEFTV